MQSSSTSANGGGTRGGASRAVVIGAGFGGLAAAVRLRALGYQVRVLEALPDPGGRARTFRRDGFRFDAGPTVITAPHLFEELFEALGARPKDYYRLRSVEPMYRVVFGDGEHFDYHRDEGRLLREIRRITPADVAGYRALEERAREIFRVGFEELGDRPFHRASTMMRALPDMIRLGSYRSVYDEVARHVSDERLRRALSFEPLLVGGDPFRVSSIYLLIHWLERRWGVHYPVGGTGALVRAMVRLLEDHGVVVELGTPVREIHRNGGRVRGVTTEDGQVHPADVVVANADPVHVYRDLLGDERLTARTRMRVRSARPSMGLFVGYFATRGRYRDLQHHTVLMSGRYRELLRDIFERGRVPEDPALYLHAPTRTDPGAAPEGHDVFYVLAPVPNNRSGTDWSRRGEAFWNVVLDRLEEGALPGLRSRLETAFYVTPDYFERDLRSDAGAAFGPEPLLRQSAYFRFHNRSREAEGLYLVGAGVHPGAGVPGVLCSARVLERIVPPATGTPTAGARPGAAVVSSPRTAAAAGGGGP